MFLSTLLLATLAVAGPSLSPRQLQAPPQCEDRCAALPAFVNNCQGLQGDDIQGQIRCLQSCKPDSLDSLKDCIACTVGIMNIPSEPYEDLLDSVCVGYEDVLAELEQAASASAGGDPSPTPVPEDAASSVPTPEATPGPSGAIAVESSSGIGAITAVPIASSVVPKPSALTSKPHSASASVSAPVNGTAPGGAGFVTGPVSALVIGAVGVLAVMV